MTNIVTVSQIQVTTVTAMDNDLLILKTKQLYALGRAMCIPTPPKVMGSQLCSIWKLCEAKIKTNKTKK